MGCRPDARQLQIHQIADFFDGADFALRRGKRRRKSSDATSARAARTNTAEVDQALVGDGAYSNAVLLLYQRNRNHIVAETDGQTGSAVH